MKAIVLVTALVAWAAPSGAQVRIEPARPKPAPSEPAAPRTTWKDQLWERSSEMTPPPAPENQQSCATAVILPDSVALVGGPGGVPPFDLWDTSANRWLRFHDAPNTPDTVRARVVGADCAELPLRIEVRTKTDYIAINPGVTGFNGVFVVNHDGTLTPAVFREDSATHELHVEAMSAIALKHWRDPVPSRAEEVERRLALVRPKFRTAVRLHEVEIGMTDDEAQLAWGAPDRVNTTELEGRVAEQWVYPDNRYIYVENGVVWAIQR